jgi:hypothetical protein
MCELLAGCQHRSWRATKPPSPKHSNGWRKVDPAHSTSG